jgi:hypothetical protein
MCFTEKPIGEEGSAVERVESVDWLDADSGWELKRAIAVNVTSDKQTRGFIVRKLTNFIWILDKF